MCLNNDTMPVSSSAILALLSGRIWLTEQLHSCTNQRMVKMRLGRGKGVAILGVAFFSGKFFHWQVADQIVGIAVLCGVIWLLFRTGG
jgi:hypothetical protein